MTDERLLVAEALRVLEIENLVLGIQDPSFPGRGLDDLGRGTPYGPAARDFVSFAATLGFNGIQLGPQGMTAAGNPSPYDGTVFARNPLNVDVADLADQHRLAPEALESLVRDRPPNALHRVHYDWAFAASQRVLDHAFEQFRRAPQADAARLQAFQVQHRSWLLRDGLYGVLCRVHGRPFYRQWASTKGVRDQSLWMQGDRQAEAGNAQRLEELTHRYADELERFAYAQMLVHEQHQGLHRWASQRGLKLYGDMQIGLSAADAWSYGGLLMRGFVMGAPPSRTNPEGQPWNYPLLDPALYGVEGQPGPAMQFFKARVAKLLEEYDGLRVDHPHGLVCPWVYRTDQPDPLKAVQQGGRLFASPDRFDLPELSEYAIARPEQLDRSVPPYADGWVTQLEPAQVDRYSLLFDAMVSAVAASGRRPSDLVCEVLSTLPHPLARVLERHGLGRFRVLQKAQPAQPDDVYLARNAQPRDWLMLGNHDTSSIWSLAHRWLSTPLFDRWADHLASRLQPEPATREAFSRELKQSPGLWVHAMLADGLTSSAQNVMIFFTDLFGLTETYNVPGTISDSNWSLRVPPSYRSDYHHQRQALRALSMPTALAMAIRARGAEFSRPHQALLNALDQAG